MEVTRVIAVLRKDRGRRDNNSATGGRGREARGSVHGAVPFQVSDSLQESLAQHREPRHRLRGRDQLLRPGSPFRRQLHQLRSQRGAGPRPSERRPDVRALPEDVLRRAHAHHARVRQDQGKVKRFSRSPFRVGTRTGRIRSFPMRLEEMHRRSKDDVYALYSNCNFEKLSVPFSREGTRKSFIVFSREGSFPGNWIIRRKCSAKAPL